MEEWHKDGNCSFGVSWQMLVAFRISRIIIIIIIIIIIVIAIEYSPGGCSPYTRQTKRIGINIHKQNNKKTQ